MTAFFARLSVSASLFVVMLITVMHFIGANTPTRLMIYTADEGQAYGFFDLNACMSKRSTVSEPYGAFAWSPNGEQIAFVYGAQQYDLYLMEQTGANPHPLAASQHSEIAPTWTTDNRLALTSNQSGRYTLYMIDLSTLALTPIMERGSAQIYQIDFHPRLNYAAITVRLSTSDHSHLELLNLETGERIELASATNVSNFAPLWSPDGTRLLYNQMNSTINMITFSDDLSSFSAPEHIDSSPSLISYKAWWSNDEILIGMQPHNSHPLHFGLIKLEVSEYSAISYAPTPCMPQDAYSAALSP